ncbi:MAG: ribonuclease III [Myxococcales bacterium]|nr:ribonuclease III [Myxococcales bacterium]
MAGLEEALGYGFSNPALLIQALTHRSYANERASGECKDNETLEFLGDAALDLFIGHHLIKCFPDLGEGALSMTRAQMVSEEGLNLVAEPMGLGAWLRLGKGEERSGGRQKSSILADALEAVIAAVYLDGGFDAAQSVVINHFAKCTPATPGQRTDFKTKLQERVQRKHKTTPQYELVGEEGPDHEKIFEIAVLVQGAELARATGHSKKAAEQAAAALALEYED